MWNTVRRRVGMLLAVSLGVFALFFAYWAAGGSWGLAQITGWPGAPLRGLWLFWLPALLLVAWILIVLGATREWGGVRARGFCKFGCWVMAVAFFEVALQSFQARAAWERLMFGPLTLLLSLAAAVVALGVRQVRQTRRMFP
jgi:hypothetical protein